MMDPMKAAVATTVKRKRMGQVGKGKKAMPVTPGQMGRMMGAPSSKDGPMMMGAAADAKRSGPGPAVRNAVFGKAARLARKR